MTSTSLQSFTIANPNPNPSSILNLNKASMNLRPHTYRLSTVSPRGLGLALSLHPSNFTNRSIFALSDSHDQSVPSDIEVHEEKSETKRGAKESEKVWREKLASFKEEALKMQSVSQEAYELYSKKAMVILKQTSDQLQIQAEKARQDLSEIAKEISEEGKEYLSTVAERSPEPVKDIVETFASSTDKWNDISKVQDFYVGIPYGALLSFGGFLSFMLTGSISAIRFGVILGGTLLALSVSSLRSWKRGEPSSLALQGQAVIASVLFLRDIRTLFMRSSFASFITALVSGALVVFYVYRITLNGEQIKGSNVEPGKEN